MLILNKHLFPDAEAEDAEKELTKLSLYEVYTVICINARLVP